MSVLDNIMTGRSLRMKSQPVAAGDPLGPGASARRPRIANRSSASSTSSRSRPSARRRWAGCPTACRSASTWAARWRWNRSVLLLDEPMAGMNVEEKQDMCRFILDVNDEFGTTIVLIEHDMGVVMDISRPRRGAGLRQEDRRRRARRGARESRRDQRLPGHVPLIGQHTMGYLPRNPVRRPDGRHAVLAGRAGFRADLQGLAACSISRRARWCCSRRWPWPGSPNGCRSDPRLRERAARQPAAIGLAMS